MSVDWNRSDLPTVHPGVDPDPPGRRAIVRYAHGFAVHIDALILLAMLGWYGSAVPMPSSDPAKEMSTSRLS